MNQDMAVVVDLDGTLIRSDSLLESLVALLRARPWHMLSLPFWLLGGKASFKRRISERAPIEAAALPYDDTVTAYLREQKAAGRSIYLATAADSLIAGPVADHIGVFDGILASDGKRNLSGTTKLKAIQEAVNGSSFEYIADAAVDLPIWEQAARAVTVNASKATREKLKGKSIAANELSSRPARSALLLLRAVRVHQWVKNLLLFLPLFLAHQMTNIAMVQMVLLEFAAFCLCASGVYVTNDLMDLQADRAHPTKRNRPFASGQLSLGLGLLLAPLLFAGSVAIALLLPIEFGIVLGLYVLLTMAYSLRLKRIIMLDVILLAGLYTVRIYAGTAGIDIGLSTWFLGFSTFIFLSLAFAKRYSELYRLKQENRHSVAGRGYQTPDIELLAIFGIVSGYLSVLVFALYLNSSDVTRLYTQPGLLWFICPILIYWISRLWLLAHRGRLHEDPVTFALTDAISYLTMLAAAILIIVAI